MGLDVFQADSAESDLDSVKEFLKEFPEFKDKFNDSPNGYNAKGLKL